jgi:signal transduction histidine kinase
MLPSIQNGKLVNGSYIKILPFCEKNHCKGKCRDFYNGIATMRNGFYACPYGMSVYVSEVDSIKTVFTCFRERNSYKKIKAKALRTDVKIYNPLLNREQIFDLIKSHTTLQSQINKIEERTDVVNSIVHEIRKLNLQIREHAEHLASTYALDEETADVAINFQDLSERVRSILSCSNIVYGRFSIFDYSSNPTAFSKEARLNVTVYKKFDKFRKIFKNHTKKNISINIRGNSLYRFYASSSFELIPLLLIENAIKYSPKNNEVIIEFDEAQDKLKVEVRSIGPYCTNDELDYICERKFRGKNASKAPEEGNGLGLHLAKAISDYHNITMTFFSQNDKK